MSTTCPRCNRPPSQPNWPLVNLRCHECETEFLTEWAPPGVAAEALEVGVEFYRQCWDSARARFLAETPRGTHRAYYALANTTLD